MAIQMFKCENCDRYFMERFECMEHEIECKGEKSVVDTNYRNALARLHKDYGLTIDSSTIVLCIEDCEGFVSKYLRIGLQASLPNGHIIDITDKYVNGEDPDDFSEEMLYVYLEQEFIIPFLEISYEGELTLKNQGCGYTADMLGDLDMREICRRFVGKRVRIEVIDHIDNTIDANNEQQIQFAKEYQCEWRKIKKGE